MSLTRDLADHIWETAEFQAEYRTSVSAALSRRIGTSLPAPENFHSLIARQAQCAIALAHGDRSEHRAAAYRISIALRILARDNPELSVDRAIAFAFARLGNFPARKLLEIGAEEGTCWDLPVPLGTEVRLLEAGNTREVVGTKSVVFTNFQARLWGLLGTGEDVAVTAPTSAGKSFVLQTHLVAQCARSNGSFVSIYLVPTRALIAQVSESLASRAKSLGVDLEVLTIPVAPGQGSAENLVYVLTQERLQLLVHSWDELRPSLLVVDEAQTIGDGARGVILQDVVEQLLRRATRPPVLFGSPFTRNPEIYSAVFRLTEGRVVAEEEAPVCQNLILVETLPIRTKTLRLRTLLDDELIELGDLELPDRVLAKSRRVAQVAWYLGAESLNLIYAGGPAECEKIAAQLASYVEERDLGRERSSADDGDSQRQEFAAFLRTHFHPDYGLATALEAGVAFHYGNMPAVIRKGIETLCSAGHIRFLACTSTLLQGVNLPAKSLFLFNPTKGTPNGRGKQPISSIDFWNLAGRAGRLGKEFEGDVFLIDQHKWDQSPLSGPRKISVDPALRVALNENRQQLLTFAADPNHASGGAEADIECAFGKVLHEFRDGRLDSLMSHEAPTLSRSERTEVADALQGIAASIDVPLEIARKNVAISAVRQQELLDYLRRRAGEGDLEDMIPVHPLRDWDESYPSLLRLLKRIHTHLEKKSSRDGSHTYFAGLALRWMRGEPYAAIIRNAYAQKEKTRKAAGPPPIATVIRATFRNIETDLRFRYVKYTNCYLDLLSHVIRERGRLDLLSHIPSLPLYLELGASSGTMVSLVGLGLSRTSAAAVADFIPGASLSTPEVLSWIRRRAWKELGLSRVTLAEIASIVGSKG